MFLFIWTIDATNTQTTALHIGDKPASIAMLALVFFFSTFQIFIDFPWVCGCPQEGRVETVDLWPLTDLYCFKDHKYEPPLFQKC